MGVTTWRTSLMGSGNSTLFFHGPSLALVALSLFSLGWLWGYGLAQSSATLQQSAAHSTSGPTSFREPPSWRSVPTIKKSAYENWNGRAGVHGPTSRMTREQ